MTTAQSGVTETVVECSADSPAFLVSEIDLAKRDNKLVMSFRVMRWGAGGAWVVWEGRE